MHRPLVSVIIPTFNRAHILGVAIQSVLDQSYKNLECLVVDDGSIDDTSLLVKKYEQDGRFTYMVRERAPKGAPTCRNIGLSKAKGEYVIFLDSDDYLLPHCIEERVKIFNIHIDCDFLIFPMGIEINGIISKKIIPKSTDYLNNFLSAELPWSIMCPIWKRTFLETLNGFKEGYPRFNDPELMIRAILRDDKSFKVFVDHHMDCIHIPSEKTPVDFGNKVYEGLNLFIPDMVKELNNTGKFCEVRFLSSYLHLWFKYILIPSGSVDIRKSLKLIKLFEDLKIVNIKTANVLRIRFLIYNLTKRINFPVERLSERRIYV